MTWSICGLPSSIRGLLVTLGAWAALGCASVVETPLPAPLSPPAASVPAGLRAGFGVRDITPPPGVGLSSFAADSRQAVGYRQRLHARAILLEDRSGERMALVVADLGQVSILLHRRVSERTLSSGTGIGADRLLLSATHTHSGPGNFFAADGLNANAGRFPGFDPDVTAFVVDGIAGAIEDAAMDLRPARAGWRFEPVWDFTFNRSYEAYERNSAPRVPVTPAAARPGRAAGRRLHLRAAEGRPLRRRLGELQALGSVQRIRDTRRERPRFEQPLRLRRPWSRGSLHGASHPGRARRAQRSRILPLCQWRRRRRGRQPPRPGPLPVLPLPSGAPCRRSEDPSGSRGVASPYR